MKKKHIAAYFLIFALVFSTVSCGKSEDEIRALQKKIKGLGGVSSVIGKDLISEYHLPKRLAGQLGYIGFYNNKDFANIDLKAILSHRSLIIADFSSVLNLDDEKMLSMSNCNQLRELRINSTDITDSSLKIIAKLPSIHTLSVDYCNITDKGLEYLSQCRSLRKISLVQTYVTPKGIAKLKKVLPQLKITNASKVSSEKVRKALVSLQTSGAFIDHNREVKYDILFYNRQDGNAGGWGGSPQAGNWLKTIANAEKIGLVFFRPTIDSMAAYKNIIGLKQISKITIVGHSPTMERQKRDVYFQDDDLALLAKVAVSKLTLSKTIRITPAGMKIIPKIKGLKELKLSELFPCSQQVFESIASCQEIKKLVLSDTNLAGINFEVLAKTKSLKEIFIINDCENIDKESLQKLLGKRTDIKLKEKIVY